MEFPGTWNLRHAATPPNPGPARSPDPPGADAAKEWIYGDLWDLMAIYRDFTGFNGI